MRTSVVLCLAVSCAMFGFGLSLECYSCPEGSTNCEIKQVCGPEEDSCLKLTKNEITYTRCQRYTDCNARTIAVQFPIHKFTFNCCQSDLCNGKKKLLDFFSDLFH
ncbi:CD59 glycoprotein-like [Echeneis naucrates]|uniref:CD59 glycoprotein-like n=1 Tax=Echeneis naucrates TaxID=173247 RepID=UPI0011141512|nr:CD59 glycoprotein-like [Echeneis naucrates]